MSASRSIGGYPLVETIHSSDHLEIHRGADGGGAPVEIVVYRPGALVASVDVSDLRDRARQVAELPRHESLMPLLAAGPVDDEPGAVCVVTRASDGPTLADVLARGPMPVERAVSILRQVAEALDHVHGVHGPHRNVHPGSIHLPGGGAARLAPPSLVTRIPEERAFQYVAPEVLAGGPEVPASDRYALGTVLYHALVGAPPNPGKSPVRVAASIREHPAALPAGPRPEALDRLVLELLDPDPVGRPGDAVRRLSAIESGDASDEIPTLRPARGSRPARPARPETPRSAAPAPPRPQAATPAAVRPKATRRRRVGRLLLPIGGDESEGWDILDEAVELGLSESGTILTKRSRTAGAICRVRRTSTGDLVEHVDGAKQRARVNGSLFDTHELREGDTIEIAGRSIQYERARPREGKPDATDAATPTDNRRGRRWIPLVSVVATIAALLLLVLLYFTIKGRSRDVIDESERIGTRPSGGSPAFVAAQNREQHAREALAQALDYGQTHVGDWEGRRTRLQAVYREFGDTDAARQAHEAYEKIAVEESRAVDARYAQTQLRADRQLQLGRLHDAFLIWTEGLKEFEGTPFAHRCQREADRVEEEIYRRHNEDRARAQVLIDAEKIDAALAVLRRITTYGMPAFRDEAEKLIGQLESEKRAMGRDEGDDEGDTDDGDTDDGGRDREEDTGDGETGKSAEPGANPLDDPEPPTDPVAQLTAAAWAAARAGRWPEVSAGVEALLTNHRGRLGKLEERRSLELLGELAALEVGGKRGAQNGVVTALDGRGRLRIEYDFKNPAQLRDWTFINPFVRGEAGGFEPNAEAGELRARSVGAFRHGTVFEGTLDFSFEFKSDTPHDLGAIFFDPDTLSHQLMFAVGNRYFTFGAEREQLFEHFIFVFGEGAWTKTVKGDVGYIRVARNPKPYLSPGRWTSVHCRREGSDATFVIAGTVLRGKALGDDGSGFRELTPALHALDTRVSFRNVRIEGTPSVKWIEAQKAQLREVLRL